MDLQKRVNVKNRGIAEVGYTLPDSGVRRTWTPNEVKKGITVEELEQLTFVPGGLKLLEKYLVVNEQEVCEFLGLRVEPEYFYDEKTVLTLLTQGSLDQLYDCLEFAPGGVLELVKRISVEIQLNDVTKRNAIKEKLGFDITRAIDNVEYANTKDEQAKTTSERRSAPITEVNDAAPEGRRTAPVQEQASKYKRV